MFRYVAVLTELLALRVGPARAPLAAVQARAREGCVRRTRLETAVLVTVLIVTRKHGDKDGKCREEGCQENGERLVIQETINRGEHFFDISRRTEKGYTSVVVWGGGKQV